jgi:hypothetical protein
MPPPWLQIEVDHNETKANADKEANMQRNFALVISVLFLIFCSSAPADEGKNESGKGGKKGYEQQQKSGRGGGSYFRDHGYNNLGIPEGHLPPPGECRVWFPGKPAGHQPPPGKCENLMYQVPPGAWLIQRPYDNPKHVDVSAYDVQRPGIVIDIGIFDAASGIFIRGGMAR